MTNQSCFYYRECRKQAGLTQEEAAPLLHVEVRTLSRYENEGGVPDDVVYRMAKAYRTPLLGWWHLKTFSPLGEFLPAVNVVKSDGDLIFQIILAHDDLDNAFQSLKQILADGAIDAHELAAFAQNRDLLAVAGEKIVSAQVYANDVLAKLEPATP